MNYAEAVKALRKKMILSQMEFADYLGVSFGQRTTPACISRLPLTTAAGMKSAGAWRKLRRK